MQGFGEKILRAINPFTDFPLLIGGLGGIAIFFAFEHLALKLIGICITALSTIALFLLIAQRIKDDLPVQTSVSTSSTEDIVVNVTTTKDGTTRFTFDTTGAAAPAPQSVAEEMPEASTITTPESSRAVQDTARPTTEDESIVFANAEEEFRIIGSVSAAAQPKADASPPTEDNWEETVGHIRKPVDVSIDEIFPDLTTIQAEPRKEFAFLLQQILRAIHNLINPRLVFYCWVIEDRQEIRIEAHYGKESLPLKTTKFTIRDDLLAQIIAERKAQIVTDISESVEADLIPYYTEPTGTRSLIAFPILYQDSFVGLLVADSEEAKAFDVNTVHLLKQFACIITALVHGYISKYDYYRANQFLEQLYTFTRSFPTDPLDISELAALIAPVRNTIHHSLKFCIASLHTNGWILHECEIDETEAQELLSSLEQSCPLDTSFPPPFTLSSPPTSRWEHIAGLWFATPAYPRNLLLFLSPIKLSTQELTFSHFFLETFRYLLRAAVSSLLPLPFSADSIHLWDAQHFHKLLQAELARARAFKERLSLLLFRIDHLPTLQKQFPFRTLQEIFTTVMRITTHYLPPYAPLGWLEDGMFVTFLPRTPIAKARSMAELIREQIAKTAIAYNNTQFTVTISVGIVENRNLRSAEEFLHKAHIALKRAAQKSNTVKIYA